MAAAFRFWRRDVESDSFAAAAMMTLKVSGRSALPRS
jgi:hypothetical protein